MPFDPNTLAALAPTDLACDYDADYSSLYALSTGFAADPLDLRELSYVVDSMGGSTVPTMATTLAYPHYLQDCGWDFSQMLHSEQKLELYRPLPVAAELLLNARVSRVLDFGPRRGAVIVAETEGRLKRDDSVVFLASYIMMARGDGGFGGERGKLPPPHRAPHREPDLLSELFIRPDQSLMFRLMGDRNPLHADPAMASAAGFERPILHGLCSYGVACRAILQTICDYDYTLITGFDVRFSSPVYPGETLVTEMWQDRNIVSFRCRVKERDVIVLNHGKCTLAT